MVFNHSQLSTGVCIWLSRAHSHTWIAEVMARRLAAIDSLVFSEYRSIDADRSLSLDTGLADCTLHLDVLLPMNLLAGDAFTCGWYRCQQQSSKHTSP